jgi:hypothetical protein
MLAVKAVQLRDFLIPEKIGVVGFVPATPFLYLLCLQAV